MKFFFDTEFFFRDGIPVEIRPISVGIAAEDGRTFSAEFEGAREAASQTEWLRKNVLPNLTGLELPVSVIAEQIREFVGQEKPEFCASYGAYDWVVLCQAFGGLMKIPANWPWFYTETVPLNLPRVQRVGKEHCALDDAATLRKAYNWKGDPHGLNNPCDCPFHDGKADAPSGADCSYSGLGTVGTAPLCNKS